MLTFALILLAIVGALAGGYIYVSQTIPATTETYLRFRCPHCTNKLRFPASRAGRAGMCPRCRRQWTLPLVDNGLAQPGKPLAA